MGKHDAHLALENYEKRQGCLFLQTRIFCLYHNGKFWYKGYTLCFPLRFFLVLKKKSSTLLYNHFRQKTNQL